MNQKEKHQMLAARHFIERIVGKGDLTSYDQLIADDAVGHCPESWKQFHPTEVTGRENTKHIDQHYAKAFQFVSAEVKEIAPLNGKIYVSWSCEKIHRGTFYGIEATHCQFSITGQTLFQFQEDGKIKEVWQSWDMFGFLRQIGWQPNTHVHANAEETNRILKLANRLTRREKECLRLQIQGKTAKDAASLLFVSPRTVEYYFENIKDKLVCENKKEIFQIARILESHGIL